MSLFANRRRQRERQGTKRTRKNLAFNTCGAVLSLDNSIAKHWRRSARKHDLAKYVVLKSVWASFGDAGAVLREKQESDQFEKPPMAITNSRWH